MIRSKVLINIVRSEIFIYLTDLSYIYFCEYSGSGSLEDFGLVVRVICESLFKLLYLVIDIEAIKHKLVILFQGCDFKSPKKVPLVHSSGA